jgi:hypothetical protein
MRVAFNNRIAPSRAAANANFLLTSFPLDVKQFPENRLSSRTRRTGLTVRRAVFPLRLAPTDQSLKK